MEKCENLLSNIEEKNIVLASKTGCNRDKECSMKYSMEMIICDIDSLGEGNLPERIEELTALGRRVVKIVAASSTALSVIIAHSRVSYLAPADWVKWAKEEFGISGSYLHHLHAVGKMLLSFLAGDDIRHYRRLFKVDSNKLLALTQLPVADVPNFITINRVEALSRDEIRALVKKWLGQEAEEGQGKEEILPGFEDLFSFVAKFKDAKEIREAFVSRAKDMETAEKFFNTGVCLLGGSLEYLKEHGDIEFLESFKAELEADTAALEAAIEKRKKG